MVLHFKPGLAVVRRSPFRRRRGPTPNSKLLRRRYPHFILRPQLRNQNLAHLDTTTGTQPSGFRVVSIAPCCSVNAAFLFAEPRLVVVVSRCAHQNLSVLNKVALGREFVYFAASLKTDLR